MGTKGALRALAIVAWGVVCACGGDGGSPGDAGNAGDAGDGGPDGAGLADASPAPDGSGSVDAGLGDAGASARGLRLFFTDLTSGPGTGGQNDLGAFVTIHGIGFGATRTTSTVAVGGGVVAGYPLWSPTAITVQLGPGAQTGDIVVHVAGKGDSNGLPFTVRSGNLYFVSASGSDANPGTFAQPWATIPKAKNTIAAGDVAYIGTHAGDSVSQTTQDASSPYECALGMSVNDGANAGTAAMPKALVVYPGASATIGDPVNLERGILTPAISGTFDHWVIAGFTVRALDEALDLEGSAQGWRVVGNDFSCPNGSGKTGCVTDGAVNPSPGLAFLGNVVHDAAANATTVTKYYHGVYFASNHQELGWNVVRNGKTCRAIQFHDTNGPNLYDLNVHDNLVFGTVCDGINFATVDPSQGPVRAYDNVIYDVGLGPDPADGSSSYAGIYVANITNTGSPGSGAVQVYDNTLVHCGARGGSAAGALSVGAGPVTLNAIDNLILAASGESYVSGDTPAAGITGSNDLFFGAGTPPAGLTASVNADPLLASVAADDFHLTAKSPAVGAGIATPALVDFDGVARAPGAFDIGAYELPR